MKAYENPLYLSNPLFYKMYDQELLISLELHCPNAEQGSSRPQRGERSAAQTGNNKTQLTTRPET